MPTTTYKLSYTIYQQPAWRIGLHVSDCGSLSRMELTALINDLQRALDEMEKRMVVEKRK